MMVGETGGPGVNPCRHEDNTRTTRGEHEENTKRTRREHEQNTRRTRREHEETTRRTRGEHEENTRRTRSTQKGPGTTGTTGIGTQGLLAVRRQRYPLSHRAARI